MWTRLSQGWPHMLGVFVCDCLVCLYMRFCVRWSVHLRVDLALGLRAGKSASEWAIYHFTVCHMSAVAVAPVAVGLDLRLKRSVAPWYCLLMSAFASFRPVVISFRSYPKGSDRLAGRCSWPDHSRDLRLRLNFKSTQRWDHSIHHLRSCVHL